MMREKKIDLVFNTLSSTNSAELRPVENSESTAAPERGARKGSRRAGGAGARAQPLLAAALACAGAATDGAGAASVRVGSAAVLRWGQ